MDHVCKIAVIALGLGLASGAPAQAEPRAQASAQIRVTIPDLAGWREAAMRGMPVELATHASSALLRLDVSDADHAALKLVHDAHLPVHVQYLEGPRAGAALDTGRVTALSTSLIEQSLALPTQNGSHMLPRVVVFMD